MNAAVIVGAGEGSRLGGGVPKVFRLLNGQPMLTYSITAFSLVDSIKVMVIVVPREMMTYAEADILRKSPSSAPAFVVAGGASRQESVFLGLQTLPGDTRLVAVHDAARPLLRTTHIEELFDACSEGYDGVLPALEVVDTLKLSVDKLSVAATVDRQGFYRAQTPQIFEYKKLLAAHRQARENSWLTSDDSQIMEKYGAKVRLYPGEPRNMKITFADDMALAEALLRDDSR